MQQSSAAFALSTTLRAELLLPQNISACTCLTSCQYFCLKTTWFII